MNLRQVRNRLFDLREREVLHRFSAGCSVLTMYWQKPSFSSTPIAAQRRFNATRMVVPLPQKGSKTTPPLRQPSDRHRSTSLSGKGTVSIAPFTPAFTEIVQTPCLLAFLGNAARSKWYFRDLTNM